MNESGEKRTGDRRKTDDADYQGEERRKAARRAGKPPAPKPKS